MEILHIEDLTFRYPDAPRPALQNVSLSVSDGEFAVICGVSGCGKSTLLRLIKRELAPFGEKSGVIMYDGQPQEALDMRTECTGIGFVQQRPESQIVTDKVWHELAFGLESLGLPTEAIRRRVCETAAYFGIEAWFRQNTAELSGGQKQLLNLAGVTVMQPKLLLLDEPTAQLDPIAAADFITTLHKLNRELGITVLLVEHRLEEVLPIADRVILMEDGAIGFDGSPRRFADSLSRNGEHPMASALPASAKIFRDLGESGECPLTVREGRDFISSTFENRIRALTEKSAPERSEKAVRVQDIRFRYARESADILRDVSLDVCRGEHLCLLGGNGTGKTTLLGILSGALKPYHGTVTLDGKKLGAYSAKDLYHKNIAVLPQDPQTVFLKKTVCEDLRETCRAMEYDRAESEERIAEIAEKLGIGTLLDRHPYDLSGGEQQKAALAKLLLLQPKLLLLDEPTKGIDAYGKERLADILGDLKNGGITVVTVTHDVEFAAAYADRCAFLFDGEIVSTDTPNVFFAGNTFYTTAAHRISKDIFDNAVLCGDVVELCRMNGRKGGRREK